MFPHTPSGTAPRARVLLDDAMMREILADVGSMRSALDLERWASWLLGQIWKQRVAQPLYDEVDWSLILGSPLVAMLARIGGARARKALTALSMLDHGALGNYAGAVALTLPGARTPAYLSEMASARIVAAHRACSPSEGEAILLDIDRGGRPDCGLALFLGPGPEAAIKWMRLVRPADDALCAGLAELGDGFQPADVGTVAASLREAVRRTDADPRTVQRSEFADLRAFLLARVLDAGAG